MVKNASSMISWYKLQGFAFLIFCVAVSGCTSSEPSSKLVEINIEENVLNVKPQYISDFDCELRYIPLKGNSVQLKTIILTDFYKDFMLVTDRFNCLLCDLQGNMITKIGNKGKGPGEYFIIQSIRFGPQGQIYLQETWTIHEYDRAGNFIRDWRPEVNPERSNTYRGGEMSSWAPSPCGWMHGNSSCTYPPGISKTLLQNTPKKRRNCSSWQQA